jgi:hypothetical protein
VDDAGLKIESSGQAGTLIAQLTSLNNGAMCVDAPLLAVGVGAVGVGNYPFDLSGDTQAVVHLKNLGTEPTTAFLQVLYDGGEFSPELIRLKPGQTVAIDIRHLRDAQTPDIHGHKLPTNLTQGQVKWSQHRKQSVIGRLIASSAAAGVAANFACSDYCCPPSFWSRTITPNSMTGVPGDSFSFTLQETLYDDCSLSGIAFYGPYNITYEATIESSDTSIAEVSGAGVNLVDAGDVTITVSYTVSSFERNDTEPCYDGYCPGFHCDEIANPMEDQVPVASNCSFTISTNPDSSSGIRPIGTSGTTQATVTIQTNPVCPNVTVRVSAAAIASSGGHVGHTGNRPTGSFSATQGRTNANGTFTTTYTAPIFGGTMTITGTVGSASHDASMQIYIQSLFELGGGTNYTLVGTTATHPDNHFGTNTATTNLPLIADDYKASFYPNTTIPAGEKLRFNDMSLLNGGKFELAANWGNGSHQEHRIGINCDVGSSNVPVDRWEELVQIFTDRGSPNTNDETATANHWHVRFDQ